jgi:hypothetical protein
MFCPSCGTEYTIELKYCNRCGANLSSALVPPVQIAPINVTKPILIIGAVILMITLGGFAGIISGTIEMVQNGAGNVSPAIPIFGMPTILTIDILLIRQLSKLISAALSPNQLPTTAKVAPPPHEPWLARPSTARLESAPSVTENTTRFLESDYRAPVEPQPAEKQKT